MSRNLKIVALTTLGLFLLSRLIFYFEHRTVFKVANGNLLYPNLPISKVDSIIIQGRDRYDKEKKFVFKKDEHRFVISSAHDYVASTSVMQDFLFKLFSLEISEVVTSDRKFFHEMFVSDDHYKTRVTVLDDKNNTLIDLLVGEIKSSNTYVRKVGENKVYLINQGYYVYLEHTAYVDLPIWKIDKSAIQELRITKGDQPVQVFQRNGEHRYDLFRDGRRVDKVKILKLLRSFDLIPFTDFIQFPQSDIPPSRILIEVEMRNKNLYQLVAFKRKEKDKEEVLFMAQVIPSDPPPYSADPRMVDQINEQLRFQNWAQTFNTRYHRFAFILSDYYYDQFANIEELFIPTSKEDAMREDFLDEQ